MTSLLHLADCAMDDDVDDQYQNEDYEAPKKPKFIHKSKYSQLKELIDRGKQKIQQDNYGHIQEPQKPGTFVLGEFVTFDDVGGAELGQNNKSLSGNGESLEQFNWQQQSSPNHAVRHDLLFEQDKVHDVQKQIEKATLNASFDYILHYTPPWLIKDPKFCIQNINEQNKHILHKKYHEEVNHFMHWAEIDPLSDEMKDRLSLFERIKFQVNKLFPDAQVLMFGSSSSCLALKGSDIDIVIFCPSVKLNKLIEKIHKRLLCVKAFEYVEMISASVPILKLKDNKTGICADIAFNRDDGIHGCLVAVNCVLMYPELRPLYFVVKAFLRERGLDSTRKGGVCSFMLINMIVYYLQTQYKLGKTTTMLHFLLLDFFKFYGMELKMKMVGISIRQGGFTFMKNDIGLGKDARFDPKLVVESPIDVLDDVGSGAFIYTKVAKHFKLAHNLLMTRAFLSESFLKLIINAALFHNYQEE